MVKIIFSCLLLAVTLALGCDDEKDSRFKGCRFPPVEQFQECPADAFMQRGVCESIFCEIEDPEHLEFVIDVPSCEFPDCFTANCEIGGLDAVFFNLETFPMGTVSIDGGEPVEYDDCFIIVP